MSPGSTPPSRGLALVTGAAGGLGRVIAAQLIDDGLDVALVDRDADGVAAAARELAGSGHGAAVTGHAVDITDERQVQRLVDALRAERATLDVLVNNAGVELGGALESLTLDAWQRTMAVNVTGAFLLTRSAVPWWRATGEARVVNVASRTWLSGTSDAAYVASKAAVVGLTRTLASELGPLGVTANAVAPSFVPSPMNAVRGDAAAAAAYGSAFAAASPLRRLIEPRDVAYAVSFLASPRARNITGEVLHVSAGAQLAVQVRAEGADQ